MPTHSVTGVGVGGSRVSLDRASLRAPAGLPSLTSERSLDGCFDAVVLAASSGGLQAVSEIIRWLPARFPATVFVLIHRGIRHSSLLPRLLQRYSKLPVSEAQDGERIEPSHVYVNPPDRHVRVDVEKRIRLFDGQKINHVRSAADPLIESVGSVYRSRSIGVVLTGGDRDARDGVRHLKEDGGIVLAQDRATSLVFGMPAAAIETGVVDRVLPVQEIGPALLVLVYAGLLPPFRAEATPAVED